MYSNDIENNELLIKAVRSFERETGMRLRIESGGVDYVIAIGASGDRFHALVKKAAQHINLGSIIEQVKRIPQSTLLVADYVNPSMAERLKEQQICFIDTVGNAYVKTPNLFVYTKGNKAKAEELSPERPSRAFSVAGLKVIFLLLANPKLLQATYREIATASGVALGTVNAVISDLKDSGYIREEGSTYSRQIVDPFKLLDRWIEVYPEKLRPKLAMGEFVASDADWWRKIDLSHYHGLWGGEIAAALLTSYLKPEIATVYLPFESRTAFLMDARLKKSTVPRSEPCNLVRLYRVFWEPEFGDSLVPGILVYADLLASGEARNIEIAGMIRERLFVS